MNNKKENIIYVLVSIITIILSTMWIKTYIKNEISTKTQEMQEKHVKEISDLRLNLETEKNNLEKDLKNTIIDIESQLNSCKLSIETMQNKKIYKDMIKKDPKSFNKKINSVLGAKQK